MAEIVYSRHACADLERLAEFLIKDAPQAAVAAIDIIRDGIEILERHPFIGRPGEEGLKELLISYGKSGYVALYSFEQRQDVVLVLAIRQATGGFEPLSNRETECAIAPRNTAIARRIATGRSAARLEIHRT